VKAADRNTAECGRETAADDVCRLRGFLTAATVYAKHLVSMLRKAAEDVPMHSELLASLRDIINKCKENIPPIYCNLRLETISLFSRLVVYAFLRPVIILY
jgi:hypothetical protein